MQWLDQAGHQTPLEQPGAVADHLLTLLRQAAVASPS